MKGEDVGLARRKEVQEGERQADALDLGLRALVERVEDRLGVQAEAVAVRLRERRERVSPGTLGTRERESGRERRRARDAPRDLLDRLAAWPTTG